MDAMIQIAQRLVLAVTHAVRSGEESVHFHAGDLGRPYVCEDRHCSSPGLRVER
jgi:hypothetical protein